MDKDQGTRQIRETRDTRTKYEVSFRLAVRSPTIEMARNSNTSRNTIVTKVREREGERLNDAYRRVYFAREGRIDFTCARAGGGISLFFLFSPQGERKLRKTGAGARAKGRESVERFRSESGKRGEGKVLQRASSRRRFMDSARSHLKDYIEHRL